VFDIRRAWTKRGELDASRDNLYIIQEILKLREEQAQMHGYANFASYATADTMAGSPSAVMNLLEVIITISTTSATNFYSRSVFGTKQRFRLNARENFCKISFVDKKLALVWHQLIKLKLGIGDTTLKR